VLNTREMKLLRLALCPGAARGEVEVSAIKLIDSLRARGLKIEAFTQPAVVKRSRKKVDPGEVIMYFGQYKGYPIREIPEPYLVWFCRTIRNHPRLVSTIRKFLTEDVACASK
jgi:hypothetical protein